MSALPGLTPTVVHQQSKHFEVGFRTDMLQGGFQRKTNFLDYFRRKTRKKMEKQKLTDCADAYQKTWGLCQISLVVYHWPSVHLLAPALLSAFC